jgi:hypothetical protein
MEGTALDLDRTGLIGGMADFTRCLTIYGMPYHFFVFLEGREAGFAQECCVDEMTTGERIKGNKIGARLLYIPYMTLASGRVINIHTPRDT